MRAILVNGKIQVVNKLPKNKTINGTTIVGFDRLSDSELKKYGCYYIVKPKYDSRIEKLDNLHLDGDVYTYDVVDKKIKETLSQLKENKISNLRNGVFSQLSKTDWYNDRKLDEGIDMPNKILKQRIALRKQSNDIEAQINALTKKKEVVLFDINL